MHIPRNQRSPDVGAAGPGWVPFRITRQERGALPLCPSIGSSSGTGSLLLVTIRLIGDWVMPALAG